VAARYVAIDEVVEPALLPLPQEGARSGLGGLQLQGQVHALAAGILLRVAELMGSISMPSPNHQTDSLNASLTSPP